MAVEKKYVITALMAAFCFALFYYDSYVGNLIEASFDLFIAVLSVLFFVHLMVEAKDSV